MRLRSTEHWSSPRCPTTVHPPVTATSCIAGTQVQAGAGEAAAPPDRVKRVGRQGGRERREVEREGEKGEEGEEGGGRGGKAEGETEG